MDKEKVSSGIESQTAPLTNMSTSIAFKDLLHPTPKRKSIHELEPEKFTDIKLTSLLPERIQNKRRRSTACSGDVDNTIPPFEELEIKNKIKSEIRPDVSAAVDAITARAALRRKAPSRSATETKRRSNGDTGRNVRTVSNASRNITFEMLRPHFEQSLQFAANHFGVCTTLLKKICRKHGISNWPHRKITSLYKSIESMENQVNHLEGVQKLNYAEQLRRLQIELEVYKQTGKPPTDDYMERIASKSAHVANTDDRSGLQPQYQEYSLTHTTVQDIHYTPTHHVVGHHMSPVPQVPLHIQSPNVQEHYHKLPIRHGGHSLPSYRPQRLPSMVHMLEQVQGFRQLNLHCGSSTFTSRQSTGAHH